MNANKIYQKHMAKFSQPNLYNFQTLKHTFNL
jgi:hypothetical protein